MTNPVANLPYTFLIVEFAESYFPTSESVHAISKYKKTAKYRKQYICREIFEQLNVANLIIFC